MASFDTLLDRIDRLLLRYEEAQRRQSLLEAQVAALTLERDSLRSRLGAARSRIDALLDRLPADPSPNPPPGATPGGAESTLANAATASGSQTP
jgi:cell division protein ZapB